MNIVCFIFARGGSQGLKNKNIKSLNGKPLIAYSIEKAKKINLISDIIVSTDSKKIEKISKFYGAKVPFTRPKALSTNNSPEILSWKHAVQHYEKQYQKKIDIFISLPTTAPLVKSKSVKDALKLFIKKKTKIDLLLSITETNHFPQFNMVYSYKHNLVDLLDKRKSVFNRQKIKNIFNITTGFYISTPEYIKKCNNYIFKGIISGYKIKKSESIDIDDIYDFKFAEYLLKNER